MAIKTSWVFDWPHTAFGKPHWRCQVAALLGFIAIGLDMTVFCDAEIAQGAARPVMGLFVLLAFLALGASPSGLGLRIRPLPDMRRWVLVMLLLTLASAALVACAGLILWICEIPVRSAFNSEREILWFARGACFHAPITEELIYRLALCAPLASIFGRPASILFSCVAFSYIHVRYGNFAISQPVAGVILAWSYLRSSCLWIPIVLHAIGNTFALIAHTALFYHQSG